MADIENADETKTLIKKNDVTSSDVTTIQFGNYFIKKTGEEKKGDQGEKGDQGTDPEAYMKLAPCCSGKAWGETLLPCVPGFNCCKEPCTTWRRPPLFWTINYLALIGHLINTILTFVLSFTNEDMVYDLKEISESWINETGTNGCTENMTANSFDAKVIEAANRTICVSYVSTTTQTVSLFNLIIWFHLLSFLFQLLAMADWNFPLFCGCPCTEKGEKDSDTGFAGLWGTFKRFRCVRQRYVDEVINDGTNMMRMIEYSASATIMQVAIALVLGIDSVMEIRALSALTILVMLLGLIAEQLKSTYTKTAWFSHLLGWFAMIAVWSLIFGKFRHSVTMSEADGGDGPPDFVIIMIWVIAIMYGAFGLLQLAQLVWITLYKKTGPEFNGYIETGYNFMSLTSKTFLGTFLIANVLFAPRVIDQCMSMPVPGIWGLLGCNVTNPAAVNVTGLGVISPADGYRECKVKCEAMGALFTVESKENRCDKIDNETWWAEKGCSVEDPEARTVTELNVSTIDGWGSCDVTCSEDNGEFVVTNIEDGTTILIGTCDQVDCSGETTYTINLGALVTGNDIATCCVAPYTP